MKKYKKIAYPLALFPLTGFLGVHQLYLMNLKNSLFDIWLRLTLQAIFYIYNLINLSNMVNEKNNKREPRCFVKIVF